MPTYSAWAGYEMGLRSGFGMAILGMFFSACDAQTDFPDMLEGETGRIVRIIDGDSLVMEGGQTVRLVGLEAPRLGRRGDPDQPYASESARHLESLVLGRVVQLYYPGPTRDRFDRALAHVVTRDQAGPNVWINLALIDRGAAWVRLYPDTALQAELLLEAEDRVRADEQGLWAESTYQPIEVAAITPDDDVRFRLLWANLGPAMPAQQINSGAPLACFRALEDTGLILQVRRVAQRVCDLTDGTKVELRTLTPGPELTVTHDKHVRVLTTPMPDPETE
ncbi:MAG: thermonuclease family protein [Pseudomonadota bacterium]